ncbi:HIR complex subunit [Didymella sp. IMI 355093]|nr:HIR complex subunit [Didymella sp. IMI 355093]
MDANDASSPGSLSSPPHSPEGTPTSSVRVSSTGVGVGPANASTPTPASATSPAPRGLTASGQPRKKPGPKPKPKDPNAPEPEKKTRKPRKPAEPKDPNAAPVRKRRAKASLDAQAAQPVQAVDEKPIIPNSPTPQPRPSEPAPTPAPQQPEQSPALSQATRIQGSQIHSTQEPTLHNNPNLSHINVPPTTPRPSSSGQRYDPIRGGIMEDKPQGPASAPPPISPPLNRASASPSITSLIDPPSASNSFFSQPAKLQQQTSITSAPQSPASFHTRPASVLPSQEFAAPQPQQQPPPQQQLTSQPMPYNAAPTGPAPMEIDSDASKPVTATAQKVTSATNGTSANTNAPTPPTKPARQKEAPPPLPSGSGLLSGTPFGPVTTAAKGADGPVAPNIYLHFDLKGRQNTTINVALEIEKKYGFAALHPRIAARQERKRQMQAAGAALERAAGLSTDDMSVDLSENESNVEMGGMDDNASATENGGKKRRKRKQEDYDKEDDFIDDTELAWEQQALMAKDGFFVYSGPLVTEEKPTVERADGTVRRGRGRGRGGTTRGETSGRGRGRGGGPGSRGGQTVRKPRVTKADRAAMEQEKIAREKMGEAIAKQPAAGAATSSLTSSA